MANNTALAQALEAAPPPRPGLTANQTAPSANRSNGAREDALVARLQAGDEAAFRTLVETYAGPMLSAARRVLADTGLAEDCVQEAFLNAFNALDRFESRGSLGAWLKRLAINAAISKLRRTWMREPAIDPLLPQFDDNGCRFEDPWREPDAAVDVQMERTELREAVLDKIDQLPPSYRTVLMLRDIEDYSTQETAHLLELSEGAVKVRLHRARAALKTLLAPVWAETIS
ncbi:MAG: RNA polymerase sigma factor [Maricaulaceae bacterium]